MIKLKKSLAVILSLTLTFGAGTPVFAAGETAAVQAEAVSTEAPATTPAAVKKPPKTGFYTAADGKTYYYKNRKKVTNKYGIKIKGKYYRISKTGVVTKVSEAEGLAGIRLDKCGGSLRKAFTWSSTSIRYWGNVGKPRKGQNEVAYYATYGFKNGRGDCYVMAATFCMMAKVKTGKTVYMVKGTVPQANGKNGPHGWCEVKWSKNKTCVYDPNFAYTYRNTKVKHHSGYKFTYSMLGKGHGLYKYNLKKVKRIKA